MPWGRIDDRLAMSVKVRGLIDPGVTGERAKQQRSESLGVWLQVLSWVSGERSDGFLTEDILELYGRRVAVERLLRARYGRAALLHQREDGERCECMAGRAWHPDWDYLIHDYLDRNPSRTENDVHRAKSKELKDSALKTFVAKRDRDRCRYCGNDTNPADRVSDAGRTFDHVDPEVAAGASNLVVACRGCNRRKGKRTPEAAGMVLLPEPGVEALPTYAAPESDLGPDSGLAQVPTQVGPRSGSGPGPPATSSNGHHQGTDLRPDLGRTSDQTQVSSSGGTGRDGAGSAPSSAPPPSLQPEARASPPSPRMNPYLRQTRPHPDHYAGNPPTSGGVP